MDIVEIFRRHIDGEEGKVAFRCRSAKEVSKLFEITKELVAPSYYYVLDLKHDVFGNIGFEKEVCYRLERIDGKLDWGHDHAEFYIRRGRKIVNVGELLNASDYGEFPVEEADVNSLLFGM